MGGPAPGRQARSAGPVGRMGCIWPARRYQVAPRVTSAACTPRRRVGVEARRLDTPAPRAAGVRCTAGSNAWPSRVAACAWVQHEVRLASMSRAAGSLPQFPAFHRRQSPRSCADQIVDGVQDTKPAARLMSAAPASRLAHCSPCEWHAGSPYAALQPLFPSQVRWRHGCGLRPNGERPCRARSAEPDIFVAQRAGGEGRRVRRRPVPVASSAEARGDDPHFLSPYLRSLLPCAGVPVASVDSPARITIRARKLSLQAELLERGAGLEVEPRRKPRTWCPQGRRAPRLPPAPRAVARNLHRGRHDLLE